VQGEGEGLRTTIWKRREKSFGTVGETITLVAGAVRSVQPCTSPGRFLRGGGDVRGKRAVKRESSTVGSRSKNGRGFPSPPPKKMPSEEKLKRIGKDEGTPH